MLPPHVQEWLQAIARSQACELLPNRIGLDVPDQPLKLKLSIISQIGSDEILLRLIEGDTNNDQALLRNKLNLTAPRGRGAALDRARRNRTAISPEILKL